MQQVLTIDLICQFLPSVWVQNATEIISPLKTGFRCFVARVQIKSYLNKCLSLVRFYLQNLSEAWNVGK